MIALRITRMILVLIKMETQREDSSDLTEGTRIGYGGVAWVASFGANSMILPYYLIALAGRPLSVVNHLPLAPKL